MCKQCGSEVSPYITECPYCGNRLRRRAPKLPRVQADAGSGSRRGGIGTLLGRSRSGRTRPAPRPVRTRSSRWAVTRPYATIALVAVSIGMWVAIQAEPELLRHSVVAGPLDGDWWRLFTYQFAYFEGGGGGLYAFVALLATGLFGWLLERRHGPGVVLALFLGAGAAGALVADAVYVDPILAGANAGALALLGAWAAPDLRARAGATTTKAICSARRARGAAAGDPVRAPGGELAGRRDRRSAGPAGRARLERARRARGVAGPGRHRSCERSAPILLWPTRPRCTVG